MKPNKLALKSIDLGNEASDDVDPDDIATYFYEQESFRRFLLANSRVSVATGKKGVGKSALIRWIEHEIQNSHPDDVIIRCRGADLARGRFKLGPLGATPNDRIHDWMVRLCTLANRELGNTIGFAFSDDNMARVEAAELSGFKSKNLVGSLIARFGQMIPGKGPAPAKVGDQAALLKRYSGSRFWFLIDDLDATFQNTKEELLELSTFFSAIRYITQDVKGVNFRVTLRTDVWPLIRRYDESLNKVEQYVREIDWDQAGFVGILEKRVQTQLHGNDASLLADAASHTPYLDLFVVERMEWSQREVHSGQVIYTISYRRPRWGIQLLKLGQAQAIERGHPRITKGDIDEVWGEYGTMRIADLVAEHKHQCPQIEDLVFSFRGCDRLMNRDKLFDWINKRVIPHARPMIEGNYARSAKEVARFMYRVGFILARSDSQPDGHGLRTYEHYSFDEMPDLLSTTTDEDFNLAFEIHPCYREALDIKKVDRSHRARRGDRRSDPGRNP